MRRANRNVTVNTVNGNNAMATVVNTEIVLARSVMSNAYSICNKRIASVPVSLMRLDKSYQRETNNENIQKLIRDWDNDRCDFLLVSYRDEKFYIVDGQHRYTAAKYKGIEELPCIIFTNLTREQEARLFARQNENVKKLTIYDVFKANIASGDVSIPEIKIDVEINRICNNYGIAVAHTARYNKNEKILRSLSETREIMRVNGVDCVEWIFDTINKTNWRTCPESTMKQIQKMLKNFWIENKENLTYWQKAVESVMNSYTPAQILGCARSDYANYSMTSALNICFKELVNGKKIIKVGVEQ